MESKGLTNTVEAGLENNKTTLAGSALGLGYYGSTVGLQAPVTKQDWLNLGLSILFAVFGLLTKDSTTGSKPSDTREKSA